jgi:hypothetical protein
VKRKVAFGERKPNKIEKDQFLCTLLFEVEK